MIVQDYLNTLTDDVYSRCKITDTAVRLPVDPVTIPDEFSSNLSDPTLTTEKAIAVSARYLKDNRPVTDPLLKLEKYYIVKRM
jgi:hypothetical protein